MECDEDSGARMEERLSERGGSDQQQHSAGPDDDKMENHGDADAALPRGAGSGRIRSRAGACMDEDGVGGSRGPPRRKARLGP